MRYLYALLLSALVLSSCVKNPDEPVDPINPDPNPAESVPATALVNTEMYGFATDEADAPFNNTVIMYDFENYPVTGVNFTLPSKSTDKYFTKFVLNDPIGIEKVKTVALTPAALNYVRVKAPKLANVGTLTNANGGTFQIAGGGSISFPPNGIFRQPQGVSPGYVGPEIQANIYTGYIDPLHPEFAGRIPCYAAGDLNNKRYYLASLGVVRVSAGYVYPFNDESVNDMFGNNTATLTIPVNPAILAAAPDSIRLWRLTNWRWQFTGMAKKTAIGYTAQIHKMGAYNIAEIAVGNYKTIRLRTGANTPVVNATVRVKYKGASVAEAQTDWDGNAIVYVPADQQFDVQVYQEWPNKTLVQETTVGTTRTDSIIPVTINSSSPRVILFKGTAKTCAGATIEKGRVVVRSHYHGQETIFPVLKGNYEAAILHDPGDSFIFTAKLTDAGTSQTSVDSTVIIKMAASNQLDLTTCPPVTTLYSYYLVDGVETKLNGDLNDPASGYFSSSTNGGQTMISTANTPLTKGLQFSTYGTSAGVYTGSGISALFINNVYYDYDFNKPMRVSFDRYDLLPGGIVQGSCDFWYKDSGGGVHHLVASFRVKRVV